MKILKIPETDSTNNYVALNAPRLSDMTMVVAETQTAGRGQRGNSWESQPGMNLTFTVFHCPTGVAVREQFAISEAAALAMVDALALSGINARVKWPNDIYVGNDKIAGILIEHSITPDKIEHSRIGIGLNVNQKEFKSGPPNPISMALISGHDHILSEICNDVASCIERRLLDLSSEEKRTGLHSEFLARMWRGDGKVYPFRIKETGREFDGRIAGVSPYGPISIEDVSTQTTCEFAFKEIEFIL